MKMSKKIMALLLSALLIFAALPFSFVASAEEPTVLNTRSDFSWGVMGHWQTSGAYQMSSVGPEQQLQLAKNLGAKLYRIDMPSNTTESYAYYDSFIKCANDKGIDVMLVLNNYGGTVADVTARFEEIAEHYADGTNGVVKYFQIFNEIDCEIQNTFADPNSTDGTEASVYSSYITGEDGWAAKFDAAIDAVKAKAPNIKTIVNFSWKHYGFLKALTAADISWDVTGIDWYTNMQDSVDLSDIVDVINTEYPEKDIILCEIGTKTSESFDETSLASYSNLYEIMEQAYAEESVIGACFYELIDEYDFQQGDEYNPAAHYGLIYCSSNGLGTVKPIYTEIQKRIGSYLEVPTAAYTYNLASAIDYKLDYSGTNIWATRKSFASTDLTVADYLEFDVYVEAATDFNKNLVFGFMSDNGGRGDVSITAATNQWVHQRIAVSNFILANDGDKTAATSFMLQVLANGETYHIANVALTSFAPAMNNKYTAVRTVSEKLNHTATSSSTQNDIYIGSTNLTAYDYIEMDVYIESTTGKTDYFLLSPRGNTSGCDVNITNKRNEWVHFCIATSGLPGNNTDIVRFIFQNMQDGETYHVANIAFTNVAPEKHNIYVEKKTIPYSLNLTATASTSYNNDAYMYIYDTDFTQYDYFEYDILIESETDSTEWLNMSMFESNWSHLNDLNVTKERNKLVHMCVPIASMPGTLTKVCRIALRNTQVGETYHMVNLALTNYPEMNNVFIADKTIDEKLNHTATSSSTMNDIWIDHTDLNAYDYIEMDVYIESKTANDSYFLLSPRGNTSGCDVNITNKRNEWVHFCIATSGLPGDNTDIVRFVFQNMQDGEIYHVGNIAFTNYPEMNNTYVAKRTIDEKLNHTATSSSTQNDIWIDYDTDLTAYDYIEMDVYIESNTANDSYFLLSPRTQGFTGGCDVNITNKRNEWVHFCIATSQLSGVTDVERLVFQNMQDGETYHVCNIAFTNEPITNWGDANGDGTVDIRDLIRLKKHVAGTDEVEDTTLCDFNDDGEVDADDLLYLKQFILGTIASLNPADIK